MNSSSRITLAATSATSKNKKLQELLRHRDAFLEQYEHLRASLPPARSFEALEQSEIEAKVVEGRDISVCVRVRPLLPYEEECGYFETVLASNPRVLTLEPRMDVRQNPKPLRSEFDVDFAFGPEHGNAEVYSAVATPIVDLGLRGGVCTVLAYGQTGSGKTHTIAGVLEKMADDLFDRQGSKAKDENGESYTKLHLSFFELLGNEVADLLHKDKTSIEIMEDKFGKINVRNAVEIEITSPGQFRDLVKEALSHRRTETTFKNDTSSRSHAVCAIRVENTCLREAEDGKIFVIDLAGSENAADSQFHDRSLVRETQLINKSLMALKDCIRNRALSAMNLEKYYHIPYRLSRLTLLLKDAFEVESHRHCKTVFIACISPSCADSSMTMNTLRYVIPIRIGQAYREKIVPNPNNPASWSNEKLKEWIMKKTGGRVNPDVLCPFESGMQLLRIPETEFIERVLMSNPQLGEKKAKLFYTSLWKLLIDARTTERKEKMKMKDTEDKAMAMSKELLEREAQLAAKEHNIEQEKQRKLFLGPMK